MFVGYYVINVGGARCLEYLLFDKTKNAEKNDVVKTKHNENSLSDFQERFKKDSKKISKCFQIFEMQGLDNQRCVNSSIKGIGISKYIKSKSIRIKKFITEISLFSDADVGAFFRKIIFNARVNYVQSSE